MQIVQKCISLLTELEVSVCDGMMINFLVDISFVIPCRIQDLGSRSSWSRCHHDPDGCWLHGWCWRPTRPSPTLLCQDPQEMSPNTSRCGYLCSWHTVQGRRWLSTSQLLQSFCKHLRNGYNFVNKQIYTNLVFESFLHFFFIRAEKYKSMWWTISLCLPSQPLYKPWHYYFLYH